MHAPWWRSAKKSMHSSTPVPFAVNGDTFVTDQGIRPDTSLEALSQLKPAFKPDGKITAGNASQISDGAAAVLLMSGEKAKQLGLTPRARIVDQTTVGCDPVKMLEGPIPATRKILSRNGMKIEDIDLIEINEAFAPVVAAWRSSPVVRTSIQNSQCFSSRSRFGGVFVGICWFIAAKASSMRDEPRPRPAPPLPGPLSAL